MQRDDNCDATESGVATFEEWLAQTAASKGIERETLLDQLVSSYWTLTEIVGLMGSTGGHVDDAEPDGRSTETSLELPLDTPTSDELAEVRAEIQAIDERLGDLEAAAAHAPTETVSLETFREFAAETAAETARVDERHESLRGVVSEEFANLRVVLEYLIEARDGLDDRVDVLEGRTDRFADRADGIETSLAELEAHVSNEQALVALKQRASRMGVEKADCEYCETTVQLALLASPFCPQCERAFESLERRNGGFFSFGSNVLRVSPADDDQRGGRLTWDEPGRRADQDDASRADGGTQSPIPNPFVWLNDDQLDDPEN